MRQHRVVSRLFLQLMFGRDLKKEQGQLRTEISSPVVASEDSEFVQLCFGEVTGKQISGWSNGPFPRK